MSGYGITIIVFFVAKTLLVVALLVGNPDVFHYGDGTEYSIIARNLYYTGVFTRDGPIATSEIFRLPVYPIFLLPFQAITPEFRYFVVSMTQLAFVHLWMFVICRWIARRHGHRAAVWFALLLSCNIIWTHYPAAIHSDFLFALLVFTGAVFLMEGMGRLMARAGPIFGAGIVFGLAALTRPDLIAMPLWLAAFSGFACLHNRVKHDATPVLPPGPPLVVAGATFLVIVGWALRNLWTAGQFTYTSVTDLAVSAFGGAGLTPRTETGSGIALLEMLVALQDNAVQLATAFIPALAELFTPARWYFHRYVEALGGPAAATRQSISEVGFFGLPVGEATYVTFNIGMSALILLLAGYFLVRFFSTRPAALHITTLIFGWLAIYFILQKGIWGSFTGGSGPRYAMSFYPFLIYFAALAAGRSLLIGGFSPIRSRVYSK